ncbi:MAG TPA: hypothetical protein VHT21_08565, partial [Stellaceae bacterium]|nr:hypothetical protein [Stellaceae bacterium]
MTRARAVNPSRRAVLTGSGALVLSFTLTPHRLWAQGAQNAGAQPVAEPPLPGSLKSEPLLD